MDGFAAVLDRHAPHLKSRTIIRYEKVVSFYRFVAYIMSIDFFSAPLRLCASTRELQIKSSNARRFARFSDVPR